MEVYPKGCSASCQRKEDTSDEVWGSGGINPEIWWYLYDKISNI
jgi:hypothetical protein